MNPIIDRDEKGHIRHKRCGDGTEYWYDASGNLTHVRLIDGTEYWYDADGDGHMTHVRWRNAPTEFTSS